jgi:RNA polymerase sigma factor (sigma-70 family)
MFIRTKLSDEEIVSQIRKGNEKVLVKLYEMNYVNVRSYILKNSGTVDDIDDVLQDSVIAVWQNVNKPDFILSAKLSTYVYSIARNLWLKQLQKRSRFDRPTDWQFDNLTEDQPATSTMDNNLIRACMDKLGDTCRKLLGYFYFDGMEMREIAVKLSFANADTAKAKKYQCLKKLEEIVKNRYSKSDFIG